MEIYDGCKMKKAIKVATKFFHFYAKKKFVYIFFLFN